MPEKRTWETPRVTTYAADELPATYAEAVEIIGDQLKKLGKKPWSKPTFVVRNIDETEMGPLAPNPESMDELS